MQQYNLKKINEIINQPNQSVTIAYESSEKWKGAIVFIPTASDLVYEEHYIIIDEETSSSLLKKLIDSLTKIFNKIIFLNTDFPEEQMKFFTKLIESGKIQELKLTFSTLINNQNLLTLLEPILKISNIDKIILVVSNKDSLVWSSIIKESFENLIASCIMNNNIKEVIVQLPSIYLPSMTKKFKSIKKLNICSFSLISQSLFFDQLSEIKDVLSNSNKSIILPSIESSFYSLL